MATLVLTTIGTIVGGPIGGAIGAMIGQQVDRQLFAPKGRRGPRLNDLAVQVSTYGQPIPKLFGTLRVAGSVIWSTDLREERHTSGGGKSGPKTTTYSYSVSFAVALSARPIRAVRRIWADGKLLRGAAGDWKSQTGFRLYTGGEDQPIDPLIAAAEGANGTPAYRGMAYAVFEDFQLADYGNHIPSLTFEVEADEEPVAIGQIAEELSGGDLIGPTTATLGGYAATGDSVRAAIEAIAAAKAVSVIDDGVVLRISDAAPATQLLAEEELGASADASRNARRAVERQSAGTLPDEIALGYYEPSRDYQTGLQRARRGGPRRRTETIELPAAMEAAEAKACAERRLAQSWSERVSATATLPWRRIELRPGAILTLPNMAGSWRIAGWTLEKMVTELKLVRSSSSGAAASGATPGRGTPGADMLHGPTVAHLLDLPPQGDAGDDVARLWVAAGGPEPGWRRAELILSLDGGTSWTAIGTTAAPAVMGSALDVLAAGSAATFDRSGSVEVELLHDGMELQGCDDQRLAAGANLAMLGDELIQFGSIEQTGPRRYRLSKLLRGRRGSEWAMAGHGAGERFVMIDRAALLPIDLAPAGPGTLVKLMAQGIGDASPVSAERSFIGHSLRPPTPVHVWAKRLSDGTVRFGWTRRSRRGWNWADGGDAPLGEEVERYRLTLTPSVGVGRTVESEQPSFDYTPAQQAADGSGAATFIDVAVVQLGSLAPSLAASRTINL